MSSRPKRTLVGTGNATPFADGRLPPSTLAEDLFEKFPERSDRVRRGVENEARHRRGSLIDRPTSSSMAVGQRSTSMRIRLPTRNASGGSPTPPAWFQTIRWKSWLPLCTITFGLRWYASPATAGGTSG